MHSINGIDDSLFAFNVLSPSCIALGVLEKKSPLPPFGQLCCMHYISEPANAEHSCVALSRNSSQKWTSNRVDIYDVSIYTTRPRICRTAHRLDKSGKSISMALVSTTHTKTEQSPTRILFLTTRIFLFLSCHPHFCWFHEVGETYDIK